MPELIGHTEKRDEEVDVLNLRTDLPNHRSKKPESENEAYGEAKAERQDADRNDHILTMKGETAIQELRKNIRQAAEKIAGTHEQFQEILERHFEFRGYKKGQKMEPVSQSKNGIDFYIVGVDHDGNYYLGQAEGKIYKLDTTYQKETIPAEDPEYKDKSYWLKEGFPEEEIDENFLEFMNDREVPKETITEIETIKGMYLGRIHDEE